MGLIKSLKESVGSTFGDQWKEFFYCEAMDRSVLVTKGFKRTNGRSSNNGSDNIISNGSGIAVADGQCMIIVEQGKVVELCAEPGEFTYDSSSEPSIFAGNLGTSIVETFKTIGKRFTMGGDTGKDQRVYYFNTKEILDNKFGTANPVPFRVVDRNINLDIDVSLKCSGVYSYKITDPLLFYTNVCGNIEREYRRESLDTTLKTEFMSALQPALAMISEMQIRPNQIIAHNEDLAAAMQKQLSAKWSELRGISIVSIAIGTVTLPEEDQDLIKQAQRAAMNKDLAMAGATKITAEADALKIAAGNSAGAVVGLAGVNMVGGMSGTSGVDLLMAANAQKAAQAASAPADAWKCKCGATVSGKFCPECGSPKPAAGWTCSCGAVNQGKFCTNCGAQKPAGAPLYKCDKCGWTPEDPTNPPKFCPNCGDVFDSSDVQ